MGGIVAPLLAGFCLATIAVLASSADADKTPLANWSIFCLAAAGVAFLGAMQYSFLALRSGSPPSAYLDWLPDAAIRDDRLTELRLEQAADRHLFELYFGRAGFLYNVALLFFLAGLGLLIVPGHWQVSNMLALAVVSAAFVVEFLWSVSGPLAGVGRMLNPVRADVIAKVRPTVDDVPPEDLQRMELRR